MELVPLRQWICDTCGEIINCPQNGYVQFGAVDNNDGEYDRFIIVHHKIASPRNNEKGCYQYGSDMSLEYFLGSSGLVHLISLIDEGQHLVTERKCPLTPNIRNWVELVRRLQTPGYEEARLYWKEADSDDFFEGANEAFPYLPETLQEIIRRYRP